jgi:curved DNA-binding protein CbpA
MRDPYDVLRLRRDATAEEIREAFLRLAKTHHPDKHGGAPEATARFAEISAAHDLLSDPTRKAVYDAETGGETPGAAEAANFIVGTAVAVVGKAQAAIGDEPFTSFAVRVGKGLVQRAATPEGREQLAQAGSVLEQSLALLLRP